jgi:hypothetical protein
MRKCAEYRAIAIAHARLAIRSRSSEICEKHVRVAASFLILAAEEAMRELRIGGRQTLARSSQSAVSRHVEGQSRRPTDRTIVLH